MRRTTLTSLLLLTVLTAVSVDLWAFNIASSSKSQTDAARIPSSPLKNAYFGELHLHTSYSLDSYIFGNSVDPAQAYSFAQGKSVQLFGGGEKKLRTPLDFAAVTDHAEFLGEYAVCTTPSNPLYGTNICSQIRNFDYAQFNKIANTLVSAQKRHLAELCGDDGARCRDAAEGVWRRHREIANKFYRPGKFTTFVAFEFSPLASAPNQKGVGVTMMHRNVIFRSDVVPSNVFSSYDGTGEDLQRWLETQCKGDCKVLTIPHNSNASGGRFFWDGKNSDGSPWTQEILQRRARIEPLVEIFQSKGSSECQAGLGLADEQCGFENWVTPCEPGKDLGCAGKDSFVQNALVHGLDVGAKRGVNPFKYGFVGATDNHNGTPGATEEDDYRGSLSNLDNTAEKRITAPHQQDGPGTSPEQWLLGFNPGGLTGVWAQKNTRESIWDALARRETFATSGTRIRVRLFGSLDFPPDLHKRAQFLKIGYGTGVPMGGDLIAHETGKAPVFSVVATRDALGAPLQKIQIVKGWIDGKGGEHLKVYDVACSLGSQLSLENGKCSNNGATVDLRTCEHSQSKGSAQLATTWKDPTFDPDQPAVYYARVFENPVCRWSTYQAVAMHIDLPKSVPPTIQERAWTSPIWYTPKGR